MNDQSHPDLADDLIVGAENIALFFGWKTKDGKPNCRRVYHLAEKKRLPIHKLDGLGLVARRSALRGHFDQLDEPFSKRRGEVAE